MRYIQDAFDDKVFTRNDISNFPIFFQYLERTENDLTPLERQQLIKKSRSKEFNTDFVPLIFSKKPISKLF